MMSPPKSTSAPGVAGNGKQAVASVPQDWDGPSDIGNPQNWSRTTKIYHAATAGVLCFSVTAGTSMITPAIPEIARNFRVSGTAAILTLSLFVLGLAVGPMIAGPLSELNGRKGVYVILPPIYMLFLMGCGFANSFGGLLVLRFLAGAAGSAPLAVGAGTVADLYSPAQRIVPLTLYISTPFLGSSFGPVIGSFVAQYKDYRWTQWCSIFVAIAAYALALPMRETYKKTILERRVKGTSEVAQTKASKGTIKALMIRMLRMTVLVRTRMLLLEPIVLLFTLYNAFTFAVLYSFFAAYPYVFERVYGFNIWESGMPFIAIGIGFILGGATSVCVDIWIYKPKMAKESLGGEANVRLPPEERLYNAMLGSFGVPIGLFWFAWTSRSSVHWIVPILSGIPFAWGTVLILLSAALYMTDTYGPLLGASAFAANGLGRYGMAAGFPLFTIQMYQYLGIAWASSLLAFLSVAMIPIPWGFYKYGPALRRRSHFTPTK